MVSHQSYFDKWRLGQVFPVPKKSNTSDPNKLRGVTLMDISNKIYRSIKFELFFKILFKHGVKYQFFSTPGVGYQDGMFTIKTVLNLQHDHNLPT